MSVSEANPSTFLGIGTWEKLPEGYALWTATSGAGGSKEAGLPNITGHTGQVVYCKSGIYGSGAFVSGDVTEYWDSNTGKDYQGRKMVLWFDASQSNSIYGKSTTVQPPAIKIYAWKRVS